MAKKRAPMKSPMIRLAANIDSLIENDKLILSQFEKLYDEFETLRNDVHEIKNSGASTSLRLYEVEIDIKTIKRVVQEEPEKRRSLESRIRTVLPTLPK